MTRNPSAETVFRGSRFNVDRVTEPGNDGQEHVREIVRHPGAVVIVPLIDDEQICLIRNYRIAVASWLIELPAGTREPDETPHLTAARELLEETGYQAEEMTELARFFPSPGILDEEMICYTARRLKQLTPQREVGERIENLVTTWKQALAWIEDGTIRDAKTICGILLGYHRIFK